MLTNYHTHTIFCDGINTPEEMVLSAIDKGFDALGFSGHGFTGFDNTYCMKDISGYISAVNELKEKYKGKIQLYLGIEEEMSHLVNRADYDYIIGSSHYFEIDGKLYPIDGSREHFEKGVELYGGDMLKMADDYYARFTDYILKRKPDIIGHFDLITKYDEMDNTRFLDNAKYKEIAEKYLKNALTSECIFEVNTGAISRGYRKNPYPQENLLYIIKKNDGKITISSDCHNAEFLDCHFDEAKAMLKEIGFTHTYIFYDNEWKKVEI